MPEPRHAADGEATPRAGYVGRHRRPDDVTKTATVRAPLCIGGCGLAPEPGDVFCPGCREGYRRDPSWITEVHRA
jgi:hypothetical protein